MHTNTKLHLLKLQKHLNIHELLSTGDYMISTKMVTGITIKFIIQFSKQLGVEDYHEKFQQLLCYLGTPPLYTTLRVNTLTTTVEETQEKLKAILTEVKSCY